jgi:hypothetical protein
MSKRLGRLCMRTQAVVVVGLAAGSSPYVQEKVIMLTTWTQPLHGGKSQEDTEEDSSGGSTPHA